MKKKIANLMISFKILKKETKIETKVNKDQLDFIEEEFTTYRQLVEGFEEKEKKCRFEITEGSNNVAIK
jgi:hypothetical protein